MEIYNDLLPDPLPTEPMALAGAWLLPRFSCGAFKAARGRHSRGNTPMTGGGDCVANRIVNNGKLAGWHTLASVPNYSSRGKSS